MVNANKNTKYVKWVSVVTELEYAPKDLQWLSSALRNNGVGAVYNTHGLNEDERFEYGDFAEVLVNPKDAKKYSEVVSTKLKTWHKIDRRIN